jgi:hypothetical protein
MVGIMGFLVGLFLTINVLEWPAWLKLLIGLGVGLVFALLAVFIQKPMAALFGFFAFGITATLVGLAFGAERGTTAYWTIFILGGILGAILVFALFEWALIIGTSLLGAGSVTNGLAGLMDFPATGLPALILFLILVVVGITYQSRFMAPRKKEKA